MPVTYTINSNDVLAVSGDSALTAGVIFNWTSQTITVPASTAFVNAQWLVDHAKYAEFSDVGYARKAIIEAYGKYKKGVDPSTGFDILAGVETILLDNWILITAKTSGTFLVKDVFKVDGAYPIAPNPQVNLQYQTSLGVALAQIASGSGGGGDGSFTNLDRAKLNSLPQDTKEAIEASNTLAQESTLKQTKNIILASL